MSRRAFIVALLIAVAAPSAGRAAVEPQKRFEGQVVSAANGAPVVGAAVSIAFHAGAARTDVDGRFSWAFVPTPPFQVIVVLSTGEVARPVLVERIESVNLIRVNPLADESVTVLGAAPGVSAAPASGTTMLSGAQVEQRSPENLMQIMETVPGVSQVSEGHASVPAVRGLARGRTLLLLDGGRVSAERRVGPSASFLDPSVVGSVEVARGPASVAYGSDAFGGVISVKTRRTEPGSPLEGAVTGLFGASGPEVRGSIEISKGLPRGGVLLHGHVRNAEDYDSPAGEVFNSSWRDSGFVASVTHEMGRGAFGITVQSDFGRDFGRPRSDSRALRISYPFENSHRLTASYDISSVMGFEQLSFTGFLGTHEQRTEQERFATATAGRRVEQADVRARDFHLKASAERRISSIRMEFGLDVNGRFGLRAEDVTETFALSGALHDRSASRSVDRARRADVGAFAQVEVPAGNHARLSAGLRADQVTSRNQGGFVGDRSTRSTAGSGFGSVTLGPWRRFSLTGQVSRGFRDPVLSDRYYRGPSGRGFITGNPDLAPETSLQADVALRYTSARLQFAAYAYQYRINDLVERYQNGSDFFFFRNRGRARLRGLEFEARADLGHGASLDFFAQTTRGQALDDDAFLDDASPDTASFLLRKQFGERLWAQARLALHADDDRPGPTEVATPGYTILDLGGGGRIGRFLEARVVARNLFDVEYRASPDSRFVLAPGRSVSVAVTARF